MDGTPKRWDTFPIDSDIPLSSPEQSELLVVYMGGVVRGGRTLYDFYISGRGELPPGAKGWNELYALICLLGARRSRNHLPTMFLSEVMIGQFLGEE